MHFFESLMKKGILILRELCMANFPLKEACLSNILLNAPVVNCAIFVPNQGEDRSVPIGNGR